MGPRSFGGRLARRLALIAWAGLFLAARTGQADGLSDLESLLSEQIVTSASKTAEGASAAPALSTSLSGEDLRRYGIRTLAEAIDFLTVGVRTSDNLNGGEVGSRGVLLTGDRGSHFLLLVDGHAMNEPLRGSAWLGIGAGVPIELIDHIEVIVGAGSVLYGSNAMLGLINVVSKRAKDNAGIHAVAESSLPLSLRVGAGYARQFSLRGLDGEFTLHGEYARQDGPYMTFGPVNTGIDGFSGTPGRNDRAAIGTGMWGGTVSRHSPFAEVPAVIASLMLGNFELSYRESHYSHSAPTGVGNYDDPGTKQTEVRRSFDLKYRHTISALLDVSARLYGDTFSFQNDLMASRGSLCPYTSSGSAPTCDYRDRGEAKWAGLEMQTTWDWLHDARLVTMAGSDVRWRSMTSAHDKTDLATGKSFLAANQNIPGLDASDLTLGAYLQQTWTPTPRLHLNAGGRLDRDARFSAVLVKRFSVSWEAWKNGLLKLAYAEAFRAPSYDESNDSAADRIAANAITTQNGKDAAASGPGLNFGRPLRPETVQSFEASIQQKLGPHRFLLGAFFSRWNDLVQLRQLSSDETRQAARNSLLPPLANGVMMTQYQNAEALDNYGLNLAIDGSVGVEMLQYGLSATVAKAKYRDTPTFEAPSNGLAEAGRNGNIAPQIFGNARLAYVPGGVLPVIAVAAQLTGPRPPDQFLIMPDGRVLEPYAPTQVQARLAISGVLPKLKRLGYRLAADYAFADRGPYAVGPVMGVASSPTAAFEQTPPRLIPVSRLRISLGLQVDF